jgi:ubiquinone/menaquinone biosynthesis C-methylase UbiE
VTQRTRERRDEPGIEAVPWFQAAFGALYPIVYSHRDDTAAEREARYAKDALGIAAKDRVLDLACGDGRHLVALARMGAHAVGVDLSTALVTRARVRRAKARSDLRQPRFSVVRADLRALPFAARSFRHATCFFTSFGYFDTESENLQVLRETARVLDDHGRFLLDVPDRAALEGALVAKDESEREGLRVCCERAIDRGRVRKKVTVTNARGEEVARFEESVRVYTLGELRALLSEAGFRPIREAGAFDGRPIERGDRYIIAAERTT